MPIVKAFASLFPKSDRGVWGRVAPEYPHTRSRRQSVDAYEYQHTVGVFYFGKKLLVSVIKTGIDQFYIEVQGEKGNERICVAVLNDKQTWARLVCLFFYRCVGVISAEKNTVFVLFLRLF